MQANKTMAPFHNKGWQYFQKLDEIMPNMNARGSHAFSVMNTAPPSAPEDDDAEEVAAGVSGSSGQDSHTNDDAMEVDRDGYASTLISAQTSKCKLILDDDTVTLDSGSRGPPTSSENTSMTSLPSSTLSLEPSHKNSTKLISSISTSSKLQLKGAPSRHSKASTSVSFSSHGMKTSGKFSSDLLVHDMQGSINMLTSTVRDSMESDPVTKVRQHTVWLLQTRDDGLSANQKILSLQTSML